MSLESFKEGLMELYQGEVIGETILNEVYSFFDDPENKYKIGVMLQLETETKARLRPALIQLGLDITELQSTRELGMEMSQELKGKSWEETLSAIAGQVGPFVERYKEIAEDAPTEYRAIADSMVVHEQSLYNFTKLELAGDTETSLDSITVQLEHKFPKL